MPVLVQGLKLACLGVKTQ